MRGIILNLKRLESEDIRKSTRPFGIKKHREFEKEVKKFSDIIGIFICVEKGDKINYLNSLINRIIEINNQFYKLSEIIIIPFAHLSNKLETPEKAKKIIENLKDKLELKGFKTNKIIFGTHKRFLLEIQGQVASVSYFEIPYRKHKK